MTTNASTSIAGRLFVPATFTRMVCVPPVVQ
jgi:hypothetical protein